MAGAENIQFGLSIPEIGAGNPILNFDIRPGAVSKWLQELPLGSADDAARMIYSILFETNRHSIEAKKRFKLLEQLRAHLHLIQENLRRQFLGQSFPLSSRARKRVSITAGLLHEFSNGYKRIVVDLLDENRHGQRKLLALGAHRALGCLSCTLLNSYQLYQHPEPLIWEEIHRLYYICEKMDLLSANCKDPADKHSPLISVGLLYRHIVLFALANPGRLRQVDILSAYTLLKDYAFTLNLGRKRPSNPGPQDLYCRLDTDVPPSQLAIPSDCVPKYLRFSSLTPLINSLYEALGNDSFSEKQEALTRRLLALWKQGRKRTHSRHYTDGIMQLGVGLFMTHKLLARKVDDITRQITTHSAPPVNQENSYRFSEHGGINPVIDTHTEFSIDASDTGLAPSSASPDNNSTRTPLPRVDRDRINSDFHPPSTSQKTRPWKILDTSHSGYCLIWDHEEPCGVQVGELLALGQTSESSNWVIGVIRWMHYLNGFGIKMGVQVLSRHACAAESRPADSANIIKYRFECIYLADKDTGQLLIPAQRCKVGDTLTIREDSTRRKIRLTTLNEDTGNYALFSYQPCEQTPTQAAS
jgi:hypothetical protein